MCEINYPAIWSSNLDAAKRKRGALKAGNRNEERDGNVENGQQHRHTWFSQGLSGKWNQSSIVLINHRRAE